MPKSSIDNLVTSVRKAPQRPRQSGGVIHQKAFGQFQGQIAGIDAALVDDQETVSIVTLRAKLFGRQVPAILIRCPGPAIITAALGASRFKRHSPTGMMIRPDSSAANELIGKTIYRSVCAGG